MIPPRRRAALACLALGLLAGILGGCANLPRDRRSWGTAESLPRARTEAAPVPEFPVPRDLAASELRRANPAVVALLDTAGQRSRAGRPDEAAAALERALRIEPGNPEVWARLAAVRLDQGQPGQAEPLALKALDLAESGDRALRARCHRLVARARRALGDEAGARSAEARALAVEGG